MRHGVRLDEKNPDADWGDKAERPYDTPLATDADSHAVRAAVVGPTRSTGKIPHSFSYSRASSYLYFICGFLLEIVLSLEQTQSTHILYSTLLLEMDIAGQEIQNLV